MIRGLMSDDQWAIFEAFVIKPVISFFSQEG